MKKLLSISVLLQVITGLMAVTLVTTFAIFAEQAFERRQIAKRVFAIADISRDMFMAMQMIRVERGTVNTALETLQISDADTQADIAALRDKSGRALDSALAKLDAAALDGTGPWLSEIRERRAAFAALREQADAALRQSKDRRPGALSGDWVLAGGKLVKGIDDLSEQLSSDIDDADAFIAEMMQIKRLGWVVRDAAGYDRLLVGAAIANASGISAEQRQSLALQSGRIGAAWEIIEDKMRQPDAPPQLRTATATADAVYFGDLRAMRKTIIDDLAAGKPARVSGSDWVRLSNPGLASVMAVANTAFDLTEIHAAEQSAAAERNFYAATLLAALFVGFGVFATLFVIWRVAQPMARITEAMRAVARGDLAVDIPFVRRADEVGLLARALSTFRDNAREQQRMEGELLRSEQLRQTTEDLRRSQEHLARAQRIANMGSDVRDLHTDVAEWSDESYRIFGVSRGTFTPTTENFLGLVHPDDRPVVLATRDQIKQGICPPPFEYRIVRPDGGVRHIRRETELIRDDAGTVIRLIGTIHDITEQREAQQRQNELERQLLHSQKLEALGTLAGGIAHDLNNTLVPIMALTKLAQVQTEKGSKVHSRLDTVLRASERARDLVKQILAFSRKEDLVTQEVDLGAVIRETLHMLRASLPATVEIVERISDVPLVLGDSGQLQQVVVNMMTNAAQAIDGKIGRITVSLSTVVEDRARQVRLAIADTGRGMDKDTLARAFEPFFTTKSVGDGTGLGLAVAHGIVVSHGGHISVRSNPGEGCEFIVLLPSLAHQVVALSAKQAIA
jgi:PAS domain S-box-containing protein